MLKNDNVFIEIKYSNDSYEYLSKYIEYMDTATSLKDKPKIFIIYVKFVFSSYSNQ